MEENENNREEAGSVHNAKSDIPDEVLSSSIRSFNENHYNDLCDKYLSVKTCRRMGELPSGRVIRRQYRERYVDSFTKLASKIDNLLNTKQHEKVYNILCQLHDWEIDPRKRAVFADSKDAQEDGIQGYAYVDLTQQDDEVDLTNEDDEETHSSLKEPETAGIKQEAVI